jgi:predicted nucleotidyltransferase
VTRAQSQAPATLVEPLKRVLDDTPGVRLAVLFGSAAKGALKSDSDIDIGVSIEGHGDVEPALRVALERAVGRSVDVVMLDEAPPLVRFEIARDGVVLVERHPHGWADFRAHAMIDWWDWAPTARMMHAVMAARLRDEARRGPA